MLPYTQGVYKIENQKNGKVYIGSTKNLNFRKSGHLTDLRHNRGHNTHLQNAWNKYGKDNFTFEVLEEFDGETEALREKEKHWIEEYNATDREQGYNVRANPTTNEGINHSEETKQKISETKKGVSIDYTMTAEERAWRAKRCKEFRPRDYMTEEQNEKRLEYLREAIKDKPISEDHKEAISEHNSGAGNGQAKLTEDAVILIKYELENSDKTHWELADQFGISRSGISAISRGERWANTNYDTMNDAVEALEGYVSL